MIRAGVDLVKNSKSAIYIELMKNDLKCGKLMSNFVNHSIKDIVLAQII